MASKSDPRIGITHDDHIDWPSVDINGRPYRRPPQATRGIGGRRFVVLPMGYVDTDGTIDELIAKYGTPSGKEAAKPAEADPNEG